MVKCCNKVCSWLPNVIYFPSKSCYRHIYPDYLAYSGPKWTLFKDKLNFSLIILNK